VYKAIQLESFVFQASAVIIGVAASQALPYARFCCKTDQYMSCYFCCCDWYCITRQLIDTLLDNRKNDIVHRRIMAGKNPVRQVFWLENSNGIAPNMELLPMPPQAPRHSRAAIALDDDTEPEDDFQDNYSNPYSASQQAGASSSSTAAAGSDAGGSSSTATSAVAVLAAQAAAAGPHGADAAAGSSGNSSATAPDTAASGAGGSAPKRRKLAPKAPAKGSTAAGKRKATATTSSGTTAGDSAAAGGSSADSTSRSAKAAATAAAAAAELVQPTGMIPTAAAVFASTAAGDRTTAGRLRTTRKRDAPDYQPPMQSVTEKRGQLYLSIVNKHRVISKVDASAKMAEEEAKTM
jgi:hypothetical protein